MQVRELKDWLTRELRAVSDPGELQSLVMILMQDFTGLSVTRILTEPDDLLEGLDPAVVRKALDRLLEHEPVQYVTGRAPFFGLTLRVGPGVLIPRGETEELVDWILKDTQVRKPVYENLRILDVGCGSGAISVALALNLPGCEVTAIDVSETAVGMTLENWSPLKPEYPAGASPGSRLNAFVYDFIHGAEEGAGRAEFSLPFEIIVSNPPYIEQSRRGHLAPRVKEYEPAEALFVPDEDPLLFYRHLAIFASRHLSPTGALFLEINERFGRETLELVSNYFTNTELRKDLHGKDRLIRAVNE